MSKKIELQVHIDKVSAGTKVEDFIRPTKSNTIETLDDLKKSGLRLGTLPDVETDYGFQNFIRTKQLKQNPMPHVPRAMAEQFEDDEEE